MGVGVLAAIILFQQEIRKFLLLLGKTTAINDIHLFRQVFSSWTQKIIGKTDMVPVIESIKLLAASNTCLLYTSPSPRDRTRSRMPSSA